MGVVLFHAAEGGHIPAFLQSLPTPFAAAFLHGNLGVAIFFSLSGFVIAHSLRALHVKPAIAARFMLRRAIRLDPPYWTAIAFTISASVISAHLLAGKTPTPVTPDQIAAHLFYLQEALRYSAISTVFWTLCQEIQFYLGYALLLCAAHTFTNKETGTLIV